MTWYQVRAEFPHGGLMLFSVEAADKGMAVLQAESVLAVLPAAAAITPEITEVMPWAGSR